MIPKKPAPDLIRGGYRFSEKIMLKQQAKAKWRSNPTSSRFSALQEKSRRARETAPACFLFPFNFGSAAAPPRRELEAA